MKNLIKKILVEEIDQIEGRGVDVDGDVENIDYEYNQAVELAQEVERWWESKDRKEFFRRHNGYIWDSDRAAAKDYKSTLVYDYLKSLGKQHKYYSDFKRWFDCIVDEIDDVFQNKCWIHLNSGKPYYKSSSFYVDPEIDLT